MLIYTLSEAYEPDEVIEEFESFIWTERYREHGDFELVCLDSVKNKDMLNVGTMVGHSETRWAMVIESRVRSVDQEGRRILTLKGRSLSVILSRRVAGPNINNEETFLLGPAGYVISNIVKPFTKEGSRVSSDDLITNMDVLVQTRDTKTTSLALSWGTVYDLVKSAADSSDLGFSIKLSETPGRLVFTVYQGQIRDGVEFGESLDNLTDTKEVRSTASYYNICYVRAKDSNTVAAVAHEDDNIHVRGFDRRVMYIDANDIDPAKYSLNDLTEVLRQRGREALAENRYEDAIDGVVSTDTLYTYNFDYSLGDIVFVYTDDLKRTLEHRVIEYIWAWDHEGLRGYPTYEALTRPLKDTDRI